MFIILVILFHHFFLSSNVIASTSDVINGTFDKDDIYRAPLFKPSDYIENQYFVIFNNHSAKNEIVEMLRNQAMPKDSSFKIHHKYELIPGVAVTMSKNSLKVLRKLKQVKFVEYDSVVRIVSEKFFKDPFCSTEHDAEWCLSRVSIVNQNAPYDYRYFKKAGRGVTIYIIDTGVNIKHPEVAGRATFGANFISGEPAEDLNGHGTACASLAAGNIAGVAKYANIVAVKVLDKHGSGSNTGVVAGLDWVAQQVLFGIQLRQQNTATKMAYHMKYPPYSPYKWPFFVDSTNTNQIISMSLGGSLNQAVNMAVANAFDKGTFVVVAAGNEASDACFVSPASEPKAYTVAASNITNTLASFSNFGSCVDIISPGVNCKLADAFTDGFTHFSGTSMATPLVAGWAAIRKGINQRITPKDMTNLLNQRAKLNVIHGDLKGTVNKFIHSTCF